MNPKRVERNVSTQYSDNSQNRASSSQTEGQSSEAVAFKSAEYKKRYSGPQVCYKRQQQGHISQGCRNPRVSSDGKRTETTGTSLSREVTGSDNSNTNKPIRNTRFQEVPKQISDSSSDSSDEVEIETRANQISIEVNTVLSRAETTKKSTTRVPLIDSNCQEIFFFNNVEIYRIYRKLRKFYFIFFKHKKNKISRGFHLIRITVVPISAYMFFFLFSRCL